MVSFTIKNIDPRLKDLVNGKGFDTASDFINALYENSLVEKACKDDYEAYNSSSHWKDWIEAFSFLDSLK